MNTADVVVNVGAVYEPDEHNKIASGLGHLVKFKHQCSHNEGGKFDEREADGSWAFVTFLSFCAGKTMLADVNPTYDFCC